MGFSHLPEPKLEGKYIYAGLDLADWSRLGNFTHCVKCHEVVLDTEQNSYTMEEEITLYEYAEFLKEKAGVGASLIKFEWVGTAKEDAQSILIKDNRVNQTPQTILAETLKEHGMELRTMDTALDGTVVIGYPASKKGELEEDKPQPPGSKPSTCTSNHSHHRSWTDGKCETNTETSGHTVRHLGWNRSEENFWY